MEVALMVVLLKDASEYVSMKEAAEMLKLSYPELRFGIHRGDYPLLDVTRIGEGRGCTVLISRASVFKQIEESKPVTKRPPILQEQLFKKDMEKLVDRASLIAQQHGIPTSGASMYDVTVGVINALSAQLTDAKNDNNRNNVPVIQRLESEVTAALAAHDISISAPTRDARISEGIKALNNALFNCKKNTKQFLEIMTDAVKAYSK
jgi:hypothetical protein